MPDFNFCGGTYVSKSITQADDECINLYPEVLQIGRPDNRGLIALYQVPGKRTLLTFPDLAEVRGLWVFAGSAALIAVCGSSVYSVSTGWVATKVGSLLTSSGPVSIADNGTVAMIADGVARYVYNPSVPYLTPMTSPTFTASISGSTMTVTNISSGVLGPFQSISGSGVTSGTTITAGIPLGPGQTGTFTVSPSQTVSSTAMTAVDGAFTAASYVSEVDGFFIYGNPGTIQWGSSSYGSPVSPNVPPSIGYKDGSSDNLMSMIAVNRELFLMGERTSEVWIDNGAFPFPFSRLPGVSTQHGCVAPYSVSRLGESFAWLARDTRGQNYVYQMNGYVPQRISTFAVEYAVSTYAVISDARAYTYQQGGHEFYVLTFPSADVTWVYDIVTGLWHKRAYRDANNVLHRDRGNCGAVFSNNTIVIGDWDNGNLYALDQSVYTDAGGVPLYRLRRSPHMTQNLNRVRYYSLQIQFEPGTGISSGQGSNPQAMMQWSDDGGFTWSPESWTEIGAMGAYRIRAIWRRLGIARDRVFQVVVTDPVKCAIISAELKAEALEF